MKRIAYSFLLIFLISCGPRSELQKNRILVQFHDSTSHEYHLLAVRDSAIIVGPGYYDRIGPPQVIPFSNINRVYHSVDGKGAGAVLGGLIGCAATLGATVIVAKHNQYNADHIAIIGGLISIPVALAGMVIGFAVTDDDRAYYLSKPRDVSWLREFACYPNFEPPEIKKIK